MPTRTALRPICEGCSTNESLPCTQAHKPPPAALYSRSRMVGAKPTTHTLHPVLTGSPDTALPSSAKHSRGVKGRCHSDCADAARCASHAEGGLGGGRGVLLGLCCRAPLQPRPRPGWACGVLGGAGARHPEPDRAVGGAADARRAGRQGAQGRAGAWGCTSFWHSTGSAVVL